MRVLVTGALGYVAPAVIASAPAGVSLRGLDAGYFVAALAPGQRPPESRLEGVDYRDLRDVSASELAGVDHIVHLAALSNDPIGQEFDHLTAGINAGETERIAWLARDAGVRSFTFASSASVYGAGDSAPRTESSLPAPLTAYASSKVAAEGRLERLAADDFRVTCLRFSTACGWSPRVRLDLVLNDFVASAITTGRISVLSDGTPWRPLIHVADMARAIWWAVSAERGESGPYLLVNVGRDDWNFQVRELADAVARRLPGTEVTVNPDAQPDRRSYRVSFARWRDVAPAAQPQRDIEEVVSELVEGLGSHPFLTTDFRSSPLMRLNFLRLLRAAGSLDGDLRWT